MQHLRACRRSLDFGKGAEDGALLEESSVKKQHLSVSACCRLHMRSPRSAKMSGDMEERV